MGLVQIDIYIYKKILEGFLSGSFPFIFSLHHSYSVHRRPNRREAADIPHPIWLLKLQDGVERTGAGDGVYRRRAVSKIMANQISLQSPEWPPAPVSSSSPLLVPSLFPPDPRRRFPGSKWAANSRPDARPSCTTRRRCALWTSPNPTLEITAALPRISWAPHTTPSTSRSEVCHWWNTRWTRPDLHVGEQLLPPGSPSSFSLCLRDD